MHGRGEKKILIAGTCLKRGSSWPVSHVLLLPSPDTTQVCYIGDEAPKLPLLVNAARPQTPRDEVEVQLLRFQE